MGYKYIGIEPQSELPGAGTSYQSEVEQSGVGITDWYLFPEIVDKMAVILVLQAAGTAKVQYTMAKVAIVKADTVPASEIIDWPSGDVTASTADAVQHITAVRLNVTSGDWKMQMTGSGEK